jgi:four helix bundle protein
MTVRNHKDLVAWQKAMDLVVAIYKETSRFPKHKLFGLAQQMRRSSVSIPSNIAEGQVRDSTRDFLLFLAIARGSLQELETQVLIAGRLEYLENGVLTSLTTAIVELAKIINGLRSGLMRS